MSCCCPHSRSAGRFFSRFARRYRRRIKKKGFEASQRSLLEGIERAGFQNATILEIGLADRTRYRVGDFVEEADTFDPADLVILDKVICCCPDAGRIVETSAAHARRAIAYSIPRDRWLTRVGAAAMAVVLRLLRSDFRPYVHDPGRIDARLRAAGFAKRYEHHTVAWLTRAYVRA